jgi:hypothetical protein
VGGGAMVAVDLGLERHDRRSGREPAQRRDQDAARES